MEEKFFKEATHVFKQYKSFKAGLDQDYKDAKESGNFSPNYLLDLEKTNSKKLVNYQETTQKRLETIRADYMKQLDAIDTISGMSLPDHVLKLLSSPIELVPRDYSLLAKRNKDNTTVSRALHDHAQKRGYILENYVSAEEKIAKFDILTDRIIKSLWDYGNGFPYYVSDAELLEDAGRLAGEVANLTYECYPAPKSLEESISNDLKKELAERDVVPENLGKAFLNGFGAEEKKEAGILTESEELDARIHSLFAGRGGEITPADVEYIRHDSDYLALREENPVNDRDIKKMKNAVDAAKNERERALQKGQTEDQANIVAVDTYKNVISA